MIGRLFVANVKMLARNRQALFWAMFFPVIFTVVFGLFRFGEIGEADIAVVGEPPHTTPFVAAFAFVDPLVVDESIHDLPAAREALDDGDLDFVLSVGADDRVLLLFNEGESDRNQVFIPIVRQVIDELNLRAAGVTPRYELQTTGVEGVAFDYYDFVLPGLVGMGVMTYGIIGLGSAIAQYRAQRILRRIVATPLRPRHFLVAIVLAHLLLAVVQSSIILAVGTLLFGGAFRGNLLLVYLVVVIGNLTFLNIGFMVGARVETAEAASGMGNAIAMPMMFFSGVFFPTAGLPWILPLLTSLLPLRPMVDAIRAVSIDGSGIAALTGELAQLAGWAAVTFVVAARVFRFDKA
ncbi:MAG TPA: ABC transporter permease [Actinomycetota bacterium]